MISKDSYTKEKYNIDDLREIVKILRAPGGCPWDREQNHASVRGALLEEAYEAADAIDNGDGKGLCEELGDVLLQVVFHACMAEEENDFNLDDVADGVCRKLILRHPHVFGEVKAETSEQVLDNWDAIKKQEKQQVTYTDTLQSVPRAFPALMRAAKVQKRASKAGFDWDSADGAFAKVSEELEELRSAADADEMFEEYGDLLFSAVNVSRFLKIDAEDALSRATDKFIKRFHAVEEKVSEGGRDMKELSPEELDALWRQGKHEKL